MALKIGSKAPDFKLPDTSDELVHFYEDIKDTCILYFYPKDFDKLDISLPVKDGKPDYGTMETVISAIHKLVIKDVVLYVEKKKKELNKLTENANA